MQQCMELTNTNRSRAYPKQSQPSEAKLRKRIEYLYWARISECKLYVSFVSSFQGANNAYDCLVMMAEGIHAFPSRTRPLSPPASMVLGPQGSGRVGRCQADS